MHAHVLITVIIVQLFVVYFTTISSSCPNPLKHSIDSNQIPEYYWKDYVGVIPVDAVEGGTDKYGIPTYVGQAYTKEYELLPGVITSGCKTVTTTSGTKEITIDKNIKILCAGDTRKFEWIPTKKEDLQLLTDRHLVVGGSEVEQTVYIGRVRYDNRVIIGKFFTNAPLSSFGIAIPYEGKPMNFDSFEVLTYNASKHIDETPLAWTVHLRTQQKLNSEQ
ncbi:hypothetical protein ILUMI_08700 [Ignelater luminosus]|uniref:Uncharacterized protein n=1 Tax=Ignelater luminosus TaxID=2038154 RepID=A0A8K0D161_IGNLU|nr:hypothetical protein ILUMI_08700 [Ignelater luminosus]